jgi:hypothetical protein
LPASPLVIYEVSLLLLHPGIYHPYRLEVYGMEVSVQSGRIGEAQRIEGEYLVILHVVDVHPDDVAWDLKLAEFGSDLLNPRIRIV